MAENCDNYFDGPQLVWVIEPENKIRFRYKSEGGSHGGLAGKTGKKTFPTLELVNYHGNRQVLVRVSLYTEDKKEHVLEFKGKKSEGSKSYMDELVEDNQVVFKNLQIISKKKDEIEGILMEREMNNLRDGLCHAARAVFEKKYAKRVKERARDILNSVRLYFKAYEDGRPDEPLCTLFSDVISNQKAASKGELKICRLSHFAGSWRGGEEVFLLCEKVQKESIKVKFYETDERGSIIWEEYGKFSTADVHYQVAIAFKTPRYKENADKKVFICLERNGEVSEPRDFTYKAEEPPTKKRKVVRTEKLKLNTHLCGTSLSSPEDIESSQSASPMSISSPESANTGLYHMQSISNSSSDDSNPSNGIKFNNDNFDFESLFSSVNVADFDSLSEFLENDNSGNFFSIDGKIVHVDAGMVVGQMADETCLNNKFSLKPEPFYGQMGEYTGGFINTPKDNVDGCLCEDLSQRLTLKDELENKSKSRLVSYDMSKMLPVMEHKNLKSADDSFKLEKIRSNLLKRDDYGNTLLHIAVYTDKYVLPILKLSCKAKVHLINVQNFKKQTALHIAVEKNRFEAMTFLLKLGADPNLKDVNGNSCYHIAVKNNSFGSLKIINKFSRFSHKVENFNDEGLSPMHLAIMQKNSNHYLLDLLMTHMTNSHILDKKAGKSLLHYAVDFNPDFLPNLLQKDDVDVNVQDFDGNTPLHIACIKENMDAIKVLLQSGADPSIKNSKQNSNSLNLENTEEDEVSDGQLPGDLTTNSEILKLLEISTKAEIEEPLILWSPNSPQESDEIPCLIKEKLCKYLDDDMRWRKLAPYFLDADDIESLELGSSPTKVLLDYIKREEPVGYFEKFKMGLDFANLHEAKSIISVMDYL